MERVQEKNEGNFLCNNTSFAGYNYFMTTLRKMLKISATVVSPTWNLACVICMAKGC
jgi:hypothetical protein